VFLGEIEMEPDGRLLVLGGHGRSGSDPIKPRLNLQTGHFADNDDWFDDTSDGPVTATIELSDGEVHHATAWVIVGPPDFAPGITNLVTLYDLLFDLGVKRGILTAPTDSSVKVSFSRHIQPILNRAMGYRWVNRAAAFGYNNRSSGHASGGAGDFSNRWSTLADPSPVSQPLRAAIVGRLRNPDPTVPLPHVHALELIPRLSDHQWMRTEADNVLPLMTTQYKIMQAWASGDFVNDLGSASPVEESLPDALDRIALEACVGAALYPGVEVNGYVMHFAERFIEGEPFRISHEKVVPGEVTQYNAVPWQADFLLCSWQETMGVLPIRLGWWPAQRPDDVFTAVGATKMLPWARGIGTDFQDMIDKWDRLGVVVDRGAPGAPFFVETERDTIALGP
jgi:L-Lysine epsilon oxidase N-terminal/L-lysine epsilon oxidase C-terminal domain